jgi:hypothetical protein
MRQGAEDSSFDVCIVVLFGVIYIRVTKPKKSKRIPGSLNTMPARARARAGKRRKKGPATGRQVEGPHWAAFWAAIRKAAWLAGIMSFLERLLERLGIMFKHIAQVHHGPGPSPH